MDRGVEGPLKKPAAAPQEHVTGTQKPVPSGDVARQDDYAGDCTPKVAGYHDFTARQSVLGTPNVDALLHHEIEIIEDEPTIKCLVCEIEDGAKTLGGELFESGIAARGPFMGLEMLTKKG